MCGDHQDLIDPIGLDGPGHSGLSRRGLLTAVGAAVGTSVVPVVGLRPALASGTTFTGAQPLRAAMHVHASWSEGPGSWSAQFSRADEAGLDVLFMTDHDFRALAFNYVDSLSPALTVPSASGATRQRAATKSGGSLHLLVESSGAGASTATLALDPVKTANNQLRTSIAGHVLAHTFGPSSLGPAATYEVVVTLSLHPGTTARPAGQLQLRYRYQPGGGTAVGLEQRGLVGVVAGPLPGAGVTVLLDLEADVARLWPDVFAIDNSLFGLAFTVTSPGVGSVADVAVSDVAFLRSQSDETSVVANQSRVLARYAPRHPRLSAYTALEVSKLQPHLNTFLLPQERALVPQAPITKKTVEGVYVNLVREVHSAGGLASLNHPFGANVGPALGAAAAAARRRDVFSTLQRTDIFGVDIIEAGYALRGQVGTDVHLALWDTFSRRARFLTGNGANDDHSGQPWSRLANGFYTGLWASSGGPAALGAALAGGRAFCAQLGAAPQFQTDLLVDGTVRMGQVSIGTQASRVLALQVGGLPAGSTVQIVRGSVDLLGVDPLTVVLASLPASAFSGSGTVSRSIDTTSSCFVRIQVRTRTGSIIAFGNPVWLLRQAPPGGVPAARRPG